MFDKKLFGCRIKNMRIANKVTQEAVAEYVGITKQTLSGIETGYRSPSIEVATALADYFFVSLDYLVGRVNDSKYHEIIVQAEIDLRTKLPEHLVAAFDHAKNDLPEEELPNIIRTFKKAAQENSNQ